MSGVFSSLNQWCLQHLNIPQTEEIMSQPHIILAIPVAASLVYILMVLVVPKTFMKDRQPFHLREANIVWNLFLTVFSTVGIIITAPRMYEMVWSEKISLYSSFDAFNGFNNAKHNNNNKMGGGAALYNEQSLFSHEAVSKLSPALRRNMVPFDDISSKNKNNNNNNGFYYLQGSADLAMCGYMPEFYKKGAVGLFCFLFGISKIPEMIDTFFLVFQKKRIIFLHWYHHITVMLYCWHAWVTAISSGLIFTTMNYFVHSIMYFYYFMCSMGYRKLVRPFAPIITILQISQMVVGTIVSFYVFYRKFIGPVLSSPYFPSSSSSSTNNNNNYNECDVGNANAVFAIIMYVSYFYLFAKLFADSYLKPCSSGGNGKKRPAAVANNSNNNNNAN